MKCATCGRGYKVIIRPHGYDSEKTVWMDFFPQKDIPLVVDNTKYHITEMIQYKDAVWCRVRAVGQI
jgi:hypothetical protein